MPDLALARIRGDDVVYEGDVSSIFDWGSITKTVTARLAEELDVDLDRPITDWIDGPASITLRSLATHTTGLPGMADNFEPADELNPWADYTVERLLDWIARTEVGEPVHEYSNLGYCLFGHLLSLLGGAPIETLLVERVLRPAGLSSTDFGLPVAPGRDEDGEPVPMWTLAPGLGGVGGLHGPIADLVTWLRVSRARDSRLGWVVQEPPRAPITWHNGGTYGSSSFVAWHREDGRGVAVLVAQGGNRADELGVATMRELGGG